MILDEYGAKIITNLKESKSQWFIATIPLPEGDYISKTEGNFPEVFRVKEDRVWWRDSVGLASVPKRNFDFSKGLWLKIDVPR